MTKITDNDRETAEKIVEECMQSFGLIKEIRTLIVNSVIDRVAQLLADRRSKWIEEMKAQKYVNFPIDDTWKPAHNVALSTAIRILGGNDER
jgi:hypothetical protein